MSLDERQLAGIEKHRGKGQQKITVEHVKLHAGSQAIGGDLDTGQTASPSTASGSPQAVGALSDDSAANGDGEKQARTLEAKPAKSPAARRG